MKRVYSFLLILALSFGLLAPSQAVVAREKPKYPVGDLSPIIIVKADDSFDLTEDEEYELFEKNLAVNGDAKYWDQFSSSFYYDQMSDNYKKAYDTLKKACDKFLRGKADAEESGESDTITYFMPEIRMENVEYDNLEDLYYLFMKSNPQYYFLQTGLVKVWSGNKSNNYIQPMVRAEFAKGEEREKYTNHFKEKVDRYLEEVNVGNEYDKIIAIRNLIARELSYADGNSWYYQTTDWIALDGTTSVCAGYSQSVQLLANACGLAVVDVMSEAHEWNKVRINSYWYNVDLTWADQSWGIFEDYFLISDEKLKSLDDSESHTPRERYEGFEFPTCNYNYGEAPSTADIYRLYLHKTGEHFFTSSEAEKNSRLKSGWEDEGIGWGVASESNGYPVYRLYDPNRFDYFYTKSEEGKNMLIDAGWRYQGVAFYALPDGEGVPVYKYYHPKQKSGSHFYTKKEEVRELLESWGWNFEGIAFYAES